MRKRLTWAMILLLLALTTGCEAGTGDRVLVAKYMYDSGTKKPNRLDVVVFRYPVTPLKGNVPTNYIKRLLGLAGETIAIFFGQLFYTTGLDHPEDLDDPQVDRRDTHFMHINDLRSQELFRAGKAFQIIQKSPATMISMRRIVYNNDFQARDLEGVLPARWQPTKPWTAEGNTGFAHPGQGKEVDWLRYQHIVRPKDWPDSRLNPGDLGYKQAIDRIKERAETKKPGESEKRGFPPQLITDASGYNSYESPGHPAPALPNWVGDLMLEAELKVEDARGEVWFELSRGVDVFQARCNLETGNCTLFRLQKRDEDEQEQAPKELGNALTRLSKPGTYTVRFANFDQRLTLWVGRDLPFDDGVSYPAAWKWQGKKWANTGPRDNDVQRPASIGARGAAIQIQHLKLWRNTYYTVQTDWGSDAKLPESIYPKMTPNAPNYRELMENPKARAKAWADKALDWEDFWSNEPHWRDPKNNEDQWARHLHELPFKTMFVQPGHYLCMGDNSPESWDSRGWGLVPQRLMLGRALVVYWPLERVDFIH